VGQKYEDKSLIGSPISTLKFVCDDKRTIRVVVYKHFAHLETQSWNVSYLPQTLYASGVRYANDDDSVVFWIKDKVAYIAEGTPDNITYKGCTLSE
jgi:membrane-bound inhibitor of C-type lysozyme